MNKETITSKTEFCYDKHMSKMVSGVAIILMLMLHIWGNKGWRVSGNECIPIFEYQGISLMRVLGVFAGVCVNIFAFNNGYAMWVKREEFIQPLKNLKRALRFLLSYWVIMALYYIIPLFTSDNYPDWKQFAMNLFGINCGLSCSYINVVFAWYVTFYLLILLLSPILLYLMSRFCNFIVDFIIAIVIYVVLLIVRSYFPLPFTDLNYNLPYLGSVLVGLLAAKYDLLLKWKRILNWSGVAGVVISLIIVVLLQVFLAVNLWVKINTGLQEINVFLLIGAIVFLLNKYHSKWLYIFLSFMGAYSLNIWFLHGMFFTESRELQWLLYWPKLSVLVMVWAMTILLSFSYYISKVQDRIIKKIKL